MKHTFYKLMAVLLTCILSGCMGIYEGGFECPPGEGTKCKSISAVNEMVNQGEIPFRDQDPQAPSLQINQEKGCCPIESKESCRALESSHIWWSPESISVFLPEKAF